MITDLNEADAVAFPGQSYDFCICGAGPAGITLALELGKSYRVLLLEGGSFDYTEESQEDYKGEIIGHDYFPLTATRLRYFGGSSNHWGGWCRPLDEYDFQTPPGGDLSGWPIDRSDLDPYLEGAKRLVGLEGKSFLPPAKRAWWESRIEEGGDWEKVAFAWSEPATRFGREYGDAIKQSENIDCYLNANVLGLTLADDGRSVREVTVADYNGRRFRAKASYVVIAFGGLENARFLLNCDQQNSKGIGNDYGLVGRYFCDHPHFIVGDYILEDRLQQWIAHDLPEDVQTEDLEKYRFFAATQSFLQKHDCLNFYVRFQPRNVIPAALKATFKERLRRSICSSDLVKATLDEFRARDLVCPQGFDGTVKVVSAQEPSPRSRVTLIDEKDRFGLRRMALDWELSDVEKHTFKTAALEFGALMARRRLGRLRIRDWVLSDKDGFPGIQDYEVAGNHHMCTTRMATTPREGVVDSDQRVFGMQNLYIGGSSVFSTTGYVNPTFTIIQMSLRLAAHLDGRVRQA